MKAMFQKMIQILTLTAAIIALVSGYALCELKTSVDITEVGMGARPIALGGAYVALADDASAVFTNPAGLALQERPSFVSMSTQLLTCVDYQLAGAAFPTKYGTFGVGYIAVNAPAGDNIYMEGTTEVNAGSMSYMNTMLIGSYGVSLNSQVGVGANIKILNQGLSGRIKDAPSASGIEADLGVIYRPFEKLTLGAMVQNIKRQSISWSSGEEENLPINLKLGASYKALDNVTVVLDSTSSLGEERNLLLGGGAEWQVIPLLSLRAGFDQKNESVDDSMTGVVTRYNAGIGLNFHNIRFDYAYRLDPVFNEFSSHYFSICLIGGEPEKESPSVVEHIKAASIPVQKFDTPRATASSVNVPSANIGSAQVNVPKVAAVIVSAPSIKIEAPKADVAKAAVTAGKAGVAKIDVPKANIAKVATATVKAGTVKIVVPKASTPKIASAKVSVPSAKIEVVKADIPNAGRALVNTPSANADTTRYDSQRAKNVSIDVPEADIEQQNMGNGDAVSEYEKLIEKEYKTPYEKLLEKKANNASKRAQLPTE